MCLVPLFCNLFSLQIHVQTRKRFRAAARGIHPQTASPFAHVQKLHHQTQSPLVAHQDNQRFFAWRSNQQQQKTHKQPAHGIASQEGKGPQTAAQTRRRECQSAATG